MGIIAAQSIGQPGTQLTMRTFHIGGAATQVSEENRIYLRYPVYLREINGNTVTLENGNLLFTRKGYLVVNKIIQRIPLEDGTVKQVKNGQQVLRDEVIARKNGSELKAIDIGFVFFLANEILIIAQNKRVDIRNGSEILVDKETVVMAKKLNI